VFPPSLVNAAIPAASQQAAASPNVDIGEPITLPADAAPPGAEVDLIPPPPNQSLLKIDQTGDKYIFTDTSTPGLYAWRWRGDNGQGGVLGWANVQLPAAEARLIYRPLNEIATDPANQLTAHSLDEVRQRLIQLQQPQPQWTLPIAIVLLLLCLEGLLGALPRRQSQKPAGRLASPIYLAGVDSR
jgi:hypothetical protein